MRLGRTLVPVALVAGVVSALAACGGNRHSDDRVAVAGEEAGLIDWMATHPGLVSVLVAGGEHAAGELDWKADVRRPLASTFKVLVLAVYAREIAAGRLDPGEALPRAEVERWYLEGTDGGAHQQAMAAMAADAGDTLSLDQVVRAMVEFSDNAATDYLLDRLGEHRVVETARLLGLDAMGAGVSPIVGALLTLTHAGLGASVDERIERLRALSTKERASLAWRLARRYARTPERSIAGLGPALKSVAQWNRQLAVADALPFRGSARDLAALIGEARTGAVLGRDAAEVMARHLSWPMADRAVASRFEAFGGKDGEAAGVLALAGFARPHTGPWKGEERIVVLLVEQMDPAAWQAARASYFTLATDLADTPDVVAAVRERLTR